METERLKIHIAENDEMEQFISLQTDEILKIAYTEMLTGSVNNPDMHDWYAIWMIELADGTHIGDLCFKGYNNGKPEIGYGIEERYQGKGYATEAVKSACDWAFCHDGVIAVEAEVEDGNIASQRVLEKCGFIPTNERGEEGNRYVLKRSKKLNKENIIIRNEEPEDYAEVENLVRESFWNVYRPGCMEHYVLKRLRNNPDFVPELDFVMEKDGKIIGQNVFVKTVIKADDGRDIPIMTMGPICILPELKRKGYGKMLLDYSLDRATEYGCKAICFEGNILFYGKSGFDYASKYGIRYHGLPEGEDSSFFLLKELENGYFDGITGEYSTPDGYFVCQNNPDEFEKYESTFPKKEKLKLPGQSE